MKLLTSILITLLFALIFSQPVIAKSASVKPGAVQMTSVNLNRAGAKEIAKALKGIGIKKAKAIVAYREKHGEFKAVEELASVKGIGVATIAKNHSRILLK